MIDTNALIAINKFHGFTLNYPHDFIERCWYDDPSLAAHFRGKFNGYYDTYGSRGVMQAFVSDLSKSNWIKLMAWIMTNFDDEQKLSF